MKKFIAIDCPAAASKKLINALRNYTEVAFPEGSADCALVARGAMLDAVNELDEQLLAEGKGQYNKRLRAMFKEAIKLHYQLAESESGKDYSAERDTMLGLCEGRAITPEEWQQITENLADDR